MIATNIRDVTHSKEQQQIAFGEFFLKGLMNKLEIMTCFATHCKEEGSTDASSRNPFCEMKIIAIM